MIKARKQILGIALALVMAALSAVAIERFVAYQRWTILRNGNWVSSKAYRLHSLMGAFEFIRERQPLVGGQLNLAEWHGSNEISYIHPLRLDALVTDFALAPNAYLWIFFDQDGQDRIGLRVSRTADFPSGIYRLTPQRETKLVSSLPLQDQTAGRVRVDRTADKFQIQVNATSTELPRRASAQVISFRSGRDNAALTKVSIASESSRIDDDFRPPWSAAGIALSLLVVFLGGMALHRLHKDHSLVSTSLAVSLVCLSTAVSLRFYDRFFYAPFYHYTIYTPANRFNTAGRLAMVEKWRSRLFALPTAIPSVDPIVAAVVGHATSVSPDKVADLQWIQPTGETISLSNPYWPAILAKDHTVLLFVGTSQTWGSGSSIPERTWAAELIQKLNERSRRPIYGLNISIRGVTLQNLVSPFTMALVLARPQAVLINLGTNDSGAAAQFDPILNDIIRLAKAHGARILLSVEAQNFEHSKGLEFATHTILKRVAAQLQIPIVDASAYFSRAEVRDSGLLFWDVAHFDDWGHHLFADLLLKSFDWSFILRGGKVPSPK